MQRILIVKTSSLGDVIHNLPVIHDIRAHFPHLLIDWVVETSFADIPRMHPNVNQVFTIDLRRWRNRLLAKNTWAEIHQFKQLISQINYDAVIDTQGLLKSALIMRQAHGTKHGYDRRSIRDPMASFFYQQKYDIPFNQNAVQRMRKLLALSLGYTIPISLPDYGIQASKSLVFSDVDYLDKPFIIGLHGTSRDSKLWPTEHWIKLGKKLAEQNYNLVLPWSNETELERAKHIENALQNSMVLPKLKLTEVATIISKANAAIGVDTGLSHLACALNIPTIAIYTDTNPALTGVLAGAHAQAINLGGIGEIPSVASVIDSLDKII